MHFAGIAVCVAVWTAGQPGQAPPEDQPPHFDLGSLRADVSERLLHVPQGPSAALEWETEAVLDHLWKSNGGALIPRSAGSDDAERLASQLAQLIEYDSATRTISWPMFGFADPASARFSPNALWSVLGVYFQDDRFADEDVRQLEANFVTSATKRPAIYDPLRSPAGLLRPAGHVLCDTGYMGSNLFVYSPDNCFDVAFKCYRLSLYDDGLVFLSHAIAQTQDPRYYFLRGTIEMLTGRSEDAKMSALGFLATSGGTSKIAPSYVYERINGPATVQFRDLAEQMRTTMAPAASPPPTRRRPAAATPPPPGNPG